MQTKHAWRFWCVLLAMAILVGCKKSADPASGTKRQATDYFQTPFQDECQFIVENIVSDLVEQVFYASRHQLPDAKLFSVTATEKADTVFGAPVYEVLITLSDKPPLKLDVKVDGPIWSPAVYQGVTAALAKETGLVTTVPSESSDADLLLALTDASATTIEKENQSLSKFLERNFSDALLHEKAAVLLGAFTLREHSGEFHEIRSPLSRMTAHLAFAQHLSGGKPPGLNGRIAGVMLQSLMNNQTLALGQLNLLEKGNPAVDSWSNALRAYNTGDYRPLAELKKPSVLERVAWFRASAQSVDTDIAWEKLGNDEKVMPDFARITNEEDYSVQIGHHLLQVSLPLELQEISTIYKMSRGEKIVPKEMAAKLNEVPERCFKRDGTNTKISVIGWGQWAMFFQRQVCHAMQKNFDFMQNKWGVHDDARTFSAQCDQLFGSLRLYAFVRRFNCTDVQSYHRGTDEGMAATVAAPHLTPAQCWNFLCYRVPFAEHYQPNPNPHINEWHKHNPPPGTAYNPLPRFNHPSLVGRKDALARVQALHQLAPYDREISYNLMRMQHHGKATYEEVQEIYQAVLPFASYAMAEVAKTVTDQPDRYEALMAEASAKDPARYFSLAYYFQKRGQDDKAAQYLEKGCALCVDSVRVANQSLWLVRYYLKKGEPQNAKHLADAAGEAYSASGLQAKAEYLEGTGNYVHAFEWYAKQEERYQDSGPLMGFCIRYRARTKDDRFEAELRKRSASLFPKGIESASLKNFQSPPTDGVLVAQENQLTREGGLKRGDVIVAVYGIRVHTFNQYAGAREFNSDPELDLIVWQNGTYRQIKASPPNHRFNVDFTDYPRK